MNARSVNGGITITGLNTTEGTGRRIRTLESQLNGGGPEIDVQNAPYDGRFTFARLKYTTAPGGYWYQGMPSWSHGYQVSEGKQLRILHEDTLLRGRTDGFNVLEFNVTDRGGVPAGYEVATVTRVVDGDTIRLRSGVYVRLIGIEREPRDAARVAATVDRIPPPAARMSSPTFVASGVMRQAFPKLPPDS